MPRLSVVRLAFLHARLAMTFVAPPKTTAINSVRKDIDSPILTPIAEFKTTDAEFAIKYAITKLNISRESEFIDTEGPCRSSWIKSVPHLKLKAVNAVIIAAIIARDTPADSVARLALSMLPNPPPCPTTTNAKPAKPTKNKRSIS